MAFAVEVVVASTVAESAQDVGATPVTLVALNVRINDFAQDARGLAWMTGRCREYSRPPFDWVAFRAVSASRRWHVLAEKACGDWREPTLTGLALANQRAIYWWPVEGGNGTFYRLGTAALGQKRTSKLGIFVRGPGFGHGVTTAAGDGETLVYAVADWDTGDACVSRPVPCTHTISDGGVWRLVNGAPIRIAGVPVPAILDVSRGAIAVAPAAHRWTGKDLPLQTAVNGPVEIRDAATGAVRARFVLQGRVLDLALDDATAAVLVDAGSTRRVDRYDAGSGRSLGSTQVAESAQDIDIAGDDVVYRVGSEIHLLAGGRTTRLATAAARPIGLSIEGRRIAWAENVRNRGRIRSITLR
jgi:hypothetical protein